MKILVAGDFCPFNRVSQIFEQENYHLVLSHLQQITKDYDYKILNLESPITLPSYIPIIKQGPNLCCSINAAKAIKYAGFDCVTLANNHFRDYGDDGCNKTLETLKVNNIEYVGGGNNINEAQKILYKEFNKRTLAIINCCEHEYSIATESRAGSAPLDLVDLYRIISEAKRTADYILVITHGGREYTQYPSPRLQKTFRWFVDIGADIVINHHQHCYSGYEVYNNKPIFYGLGNLCFDETKQMPQKWYEGYMVSMQIDNEVKFELIPYIQCKNEPSIDIMSGSDCELFFSTIEKINAIVASPSRLQNEFEKFSTTNFPSIDSVLTPYTGRYTIGLFRRGILPSFISKKKLLQLQNIVECEARRDELELYFKNKINDEKD